MSVNFYLNFLKTNWWIEFKKNSMTLANKNYWTYDGIICLIRQETWTMQEFFVLINLGGGTYTEETIERLKWELGIYVPINVGNLMSIGNDKTTPVKLSG